jgi:hypothetical protein
MTTKLPPAYLALAIGPFVIPFAGALALGMLDACDTAPTTDQKQSAAQAAALEQAHEQIGMPAISDFHEKRMVKDLYELRDKPVPTHAYIFSEQRACLLYLGTAIGYGLPYATQYTSPTRLIDNGCGSCGKYQIPQAEPNGLFMPTSAEGTWVMLKGPDGDVKPVYIEPRVVMAPFRLESQECKEAKDAALAPTATTTDKKK